MSILLDRSLLLTQELANIRVDNVGLFPKGHTTIIAGEPGIGKTWLMLSIAKSLAEGKRGIGSPIDSYTPGKSLIFAGETGVRLLANRIQLMGGISPLESCRVISSHECARLNIDTMINTAIGRKNILEAIKEYKPDIVFFDTMISFMADGKDESSQVDMTDSLRGLSVIASECNTAIVMIHHFRKRTSNNTEVARSMDEVIGSSAFIRLASLVIGIERRQELRIVRCLKSWWNEFDPFTFIITRDDDGLIYLKQDYSYSKDMSRSPSKVARMVGEGIKKRYPDKEFSANDIMIDFDISRSTVHDTLVLLLAAKEIYPARKDGRTLMYRVGQPDDKERGLFDEN